MIPFGLALAIVMRVSISEPVDPRMAPRSIALEISKLAEDPTEATLMAITAWHEGRNIANAVGDHGKALCTMQLQHAPSSVLRDLHECMERGRDRLRLSAQRCPSHPLADYASGRCDAGHTISMFRMKETTRILAMVLTEYGGAQLPTI